MWEGTRECSAPQRARGYSSSGRVDANSRITLKLVDVEVRVEGRFACENARTVLTMAGGRTVLGRGRWRRLWSWG